MEKKNNPRKTISVYMDPDVVERFESFRERYNYKNQSDTLIKAFDMLEEFTNIHENMNKPTDYESVLKESRELIITDIILKSFKGIEIYQEIMEPLGNAMGFTDILLKDSKTNYDTNHAKEILEDILTQVKEVNSKIKYFFEKSYGLIIPLIDILEKVRRAQEILDSPEEIIEYLEKISNLFASLLGHLNASFGAPTSIEPKYDILLIDNDTHTAKLTTIYLTREGATVKCVHTIKEALIEILENRPKIILLDIRLPIMTGDVFNNALKKIDMTKDIPVFFITALSKGKVEAIMKKTQVEGVIFKPFKKEDFQILKPYLTMI